MVSKRVNQCSDIGHTTREKEVVTKKEARGTSPSAILQFSAFRGAAEVEALLSFEPPNDPIFGIAGDQQPPAPQFGCGVPDTWASES
jgi:hypothetical protein